MNTMMQDAPIHRRQASPDVSDQPTTSDSSASPEGSTPQEVGRAKPAGAGLDRLQILQATRTCLDVQGYDATTIRRIAAQLDCAIGSIYRYYRDKHELLSCVTEQPFEKLADDIEQGQSFAQSVRTYVQLATQSLQSYSLMFWLANQKGTGQADAPARNELPAVIERIITAWGSELGDPSQATISWSVLHGCIMAGLEPAGVLQALGLAVAEELAPASQPVDKTAAATPHDQTPLQIMTVMRRPPLPRALRGSQASDATLQTPQQQARRQEARQEPVKQAPVKEDVCLL